MKNNNGISQLSTFVIDKQKKKCGFYIYAKWYSFIVDNDNQLSEITFGTGFGGISDIKTGPKDGFVYVLSINDGSIYRIVPSYFVSSTTTINTKNKY